MNVLAITKAGPGAPNIWLEVMIQRYAIKTFSSDPTHFGLPKIMLIILHMVTIRLESMLGNGSHLQFQHS